MSKGSRSAGGMEHDFLKFCVEWGAEKYYNAEKEAQGEGTGKRPDVVLYLKKPNPKRFYKVIVEVQRDIYKNDWLQRTMKKYEHDNLIVIRVENFEKLPRKVAMRAIGKLLDRDTKKPTQKEDKPYKPPKKKPDGYYTYCEECGSRRLNKNLREKNGIKLCKKCHYEWRKETEVSMIRQPLSGERPTKEGCGYYVKGQIGPWCKNDDYTCPDIFKCHEEVLSRSTAEGDHLKKKKKER